LTGGFQQIKPKGVNHPSNLIHSNILVVQSMGVEDDYQEERE
jgi:hypothetical protein